MISVLVRFGAGDILPRKSKLDQYLKNDDFKVDINRLIVNVASDDLDTDLEFAITDGLKVLKVNEGVQIREVWSTIDDLMEEADNRVLLHIRDAIECGHNRILLKTVDSYISSSFFSDSWRSYLSVILISKCGLSSTLV